MLLGPKSDMRISGCHKTWDVHDEADLEAALHTRDAQGGGEFWLAQEDGQYPCLAVQVNGELATVHYFPAISHPGYRCLSQGWPQRELPAGANSGFVYVGHDPVEIRNEFVVTFHAALQIAKEFLHKSDIPASVQWFEL